MICCTTVSDGERGIKTQFGQYVSEAAVCPLQCVLRGLTSAHLCSTSQSETLEPGCAFYICGIQEIQTISTRVSSTQHGVLSLRCGNVPDSACEEDKLSPQCHSRNPQVRQVQVHTDTKTKDNVTVGVKTAVLFKVNEEMCKEAFYKVTSVRQILSSFVVRNNKHYPYPL